MKNIFTGLFLLPLLVFAQTIKFSSNEIDFRSVDYTDVDSVELTVYNNSGFEISVTDIDVFEIYEVEPFYVKETSFTMPANGSHDVWVYFEPKQNILHEAVAIIKTDFRGDYVVNLKGEGHFKKSYYANSYNKSEEDLKTALKSITTTGHNGKSYDVARDNMYGTIDNNNGVVECAYTGRKATFNTRSGANSNNFNCEHTFPQGHFNKGLPMRGDLHHLFSTDVTANGRRSNYPFGEVSGNGTWSEGGSKLSGNTFEPRDKQKGRVARALFYFVVRYQDYGNHVKGQETVLRKWYDEFTPTAADIKRNEDVFNVQKNRNPFVDYPQLLKRISKISGNSVAANKPDLYVSRNTVDMRFRTDSTLFTVSVYNSGNTIVNISDFTISNTTYFEFETVAKNLSLSPGESHEILIRVKPENTPEVNEILSFNTNVPDKKTIEINLVGQWYPLSTNDVLKSNNLTVYPNPATNDVFVKWENKSNYKVTILNYLGQKVYSSNVVNSYKSIDVSGFAKGAYIVKTILGEEVNQTTLIVE